ncbi:uncharacterized protein LOC142344093 isoform X3 [Convolutriloba macropyga]|uniref:uncharacterized protein LOC142344093 isoform X3 n=1 Tax=Convolutriloba macropyga TaxID=536237 RepID=UPI003F51E5C6
MKLCLDLISSHNLKKNTGWKDLQLCTADYLILRNTNPDEKRCVHYIATTSGKFVHKASHSIATLVDSMVLTRGTQSGLKFVGILASGTIFTFDFLYEKFWCSNAPFPPIAGNQQVEILHLATDNDASSVLIVTSDLNVFMVQLKSGEPCSDSYAYSSIQSESDLKSISSSFYEEDTRSCKCLLIVFQAVGDAILINQVSITATVENIKFNQRRWRIPLDDGVAVTELKSCLSLNGQFFAVSVAQSNLSGSVLCIGSTRSEKMVVSKQVVGEQLPFVRTQTLSAIQFSADSSLVLCLTKDGNFCVFTLFGQQLLLNCSQLEFDAQYYLRVLTLPASNSGLAVKQKFMIRSHSGLEDLFVVSDGFQALIFQFSLLDKSLSLSTAIFDSLNIETNEWLDKLEKALVAKSPRKGLKTKKAPGVAQSPVIPESSMKIMRSVSVGNNNGSFPDLITAYENYLGNIGSNDTILSRKNASTLSLNRVNSVQSVQEEDSQFLGLLNTALRQLAQMYGYLHFKTGDFSVHDNHKILTCVSKLRGIVLRAVSLNNFLGNHFENKKELALHFMASRLLANILFVSLYSQHASQVVPYSLMSGIIAEVSRIYEGKDFFVGSRWQMSLFNLALIQQAERTHGTALRQLKDYVAVSPGDAANLISTYVSAFRALRSDQTSKVMQEQTIDYLLFTQKSLIKNGIDAKVLHDYVEPDPIARRMVETSQTYKERCAQVAKDYQKRKLDDLSSPNSEDKLANSTLSMLYFFLANYDIKNVLQLIDTCISCYFAPEDTLAPIKNVPDLLMTDNLEKFPMSFVNLIANDNGNLHFIPVLFSISSSNINSKREKNDDDEVHIVKNRTAALRSLARFLGRYFLANQKLFVYPSHCAMELETLVDESEKLTKFKGRKVFLTRRRIAAVVKKNRQSGLWSPQLALSLMFVCGMFKEAAKFCQLMGNGRLATAVLCAAYKLNDNRAYQMTDPCANIVKLTRRLQTSFDSKDFMDALSDSDKMLNLECELSDLFQLGIVCGVDVMPDIIRDLLSRAISGASTFPLLISREFSLPGLPLFMSPGIIDSAANCEETVTRDTIQRLFFLFRLCAQSANCHQILVKHYLLMLQKKLTKTNQSLPEALVSRVSSPIDASLLDEPQYETVTRALRSFLFILWLSHVRDQFNIAIRTYNRLYEQIVDTDDAHRAPELQGSCNFADSNNSELWTAWESAVDWANLLLPFAKFMGQEVSIVDCIISLFMQRLEFQRMPVTERSVGKMACVFYQPKRKEPPMSFDDVEDSFVFDSSIFALSHADYDLTSNEIVPFILEKKYKKLMLKLNVQRDIDVGEVFTTFVNKQRARRSYMIKNGFISSDIFFNQTDTLPDIGQLEFELSPGYLSFLGTCIDVLLFKETRSVESTRGNVPVLIPYAKQVEKQLAGGRSDSSSERSWNEFVDDLMVPTLRHYLQSAVCPRAIKRSLKQRKKKLGDDDSFSHQLTKSFTETLALTERTFSEQKRRGGTSVPSSLDDDDKEMFDKFNCIEEHFTTISLKEQISHSMTLSGKIFYSEHIDKSWSCINWLCDWVNRDHTSGLPGFEDHQMGSQKLHASPNMLVNASWNYLVSWNAWPESLSEQLYVVLPVNAQYHIERLRIGTDDKDEDENEQHYETPSRPVAVSRHSGNGGANDSLPSVTPSYDSSPRNDFVQQQPPTSLYEKKTPNDQHQVNEGLLSDAEHQILQSIDQPHLRETTQNEIVDRRLLQLLRQRDRNDTSRREEEEEEERSYFNASQMGLHSHHNQSRQQQSQPIMVDPDTLREIIRAETAHVLQATMDASLTPRSPRKSRRSRGEVGTSVEFMLSSEGSPRHQRPHSYYDGQDEVDLAYHRRDKRSHKKKHKSKSKKEKYDQYMHSDYQQQAPPQQQQQQPRQQYQMAHFDFYQQQIHPQSVGIPLLNLSNQPMNYMHPSPRLETDALYMHPSYYQTQPGPQFHLLQAVQNDENQLNNDQIVNILPSKDELEKFHEHRKMQLMKAQAKGRQQRLAWVNANESQPMADQAGHHEDGILIPTEDEVKVKLLRAELPTEEQTPVEQPHKTVEEAQLPLENACAVSESVPPEITPPVEKEEDAMPAERTPRPILKDQHMNTETTDIPKAKKTVTVVTPVETDADEEAHELIESVEEQMDDVIPLDASFEVEEQKVQDATTSPLPSPKKARKEIETQTSIPQVTSNQHPTALTVAEIKRRAGTDVGTDHPSNRAAIPPEIFLNLHFPHVQKKDFISVVDIDEKNMESLPEITTSLYDSESTHQPRSYADLHWQIVKELREGPKKPTSQERGASSGETPAILDTSVEGGQRRPVFTSEMATSPFPTPRKGTRDPSLLHDNQGQPKVGRGDELTERLFSQMDSNVERDTKDVALSSTTNGSKGTPARVTPRTRSKTVNEQLSTMAEQIQVMEETSKRLKDEFSNTHYLMDKVEDMMDVLQPHEDRKQSTDQVDSEGVISQSRRVVRVAQDDSIHETYPRSTVEDTGDRDHDSEMEERYKQIDNHDTPPHVSKLDLRGLMSNREQQHSERLLAEQAKAAAKKDEVRKWMKEKRKERLSDYIEHRKDLAQKEHSPWRQKSTLSNQEIKENLKQRETLKADRNAEFTEKRLQSAEELLDEIAVDRPNTSRHEKLPPPSALSTNRRVTSGASSNRSRTDSRLPVAAGGKSSMTAAGVSKSRSRSHSQDPPAGYTSWYEYYRLQANHKLSMRRRVAEEIKHEREKEESELMNRLEELSQLSEHSHPNYTDNYPTNATDVRVDGGEDFADQSYSKNVSKPPPKPFTSLVKVQNPEKTRNSSRSPGKTISHQDRIKQTQSSAAGPLPKPSISPARGATTTSGASNAMKVTKKTETKPRVPKTYSERLQELQREKSPAVRRASPSPVRPSGGMVAKTAKGTPVTYTQQLQRLSNRKRIDPSQTSPAPIAKGSNKSYQRNASRRDRPYASPYREATDAEVIRGETPPVDLGGVEDNEDLVSEVSDISAWSVPTKVKQLLQLDSASVVSRGGVGSHITSESPRLTNIDFSELDEMESQLSSKLDWDAVQNIIQQNDQ